MYLYVQEIGHVISLLDPAHFRFRLTLGDR
jgi:hypothetical protein